MSFPEFPEFDRTVRRVQRFAIGAWIASALVSVAFLGLIAWAIVTLVTHFAG